MPSLDADNNLLLLCLAAFALGGAVTWASTFGVRRFALKFDVVARRDARRTHERKTPLLGGTGIFLALCGVVLATYFFLPQFQTYNPEAPPFMTARKALSLLVAFALVWGIGVVDDWVELKAPPKFIAQGLAAVIVLYGRDSLPSLVHLMDWLPEGVAVALLVAWIIGITNAMNMIDGLDGLCSGIGGISALTLTLTILTTGAQPAHGALITAALAGCCLGFLFHNFNPARIFLGDSGSLLIGFALAVVSIDVEVKRSLLVSLSMPIMVLGLPLLDVGLSIFRRKRLERPVFAGDRGHIHHRLQQVGVGQRWAVVVLWLCSAYLNASAFFLAQIPSQYSLLLYGAIVPTLGFWFMALVFVERRLSYQSAKFSQFFLKHEDAMLRDQNRIKGYVRAQTLGGGQKPFTVVVIECQDFLREMANERPARVVAFYMNLYGILKSRLRSTDLVARVGDYRFIAVLAGTGGGVDGSDGGIVSYLEGQLRELQVAYGIFQSHETRPEGLRVLRYPKDAARIWQALEVSEEELSSAKSERVAAKAA